ncbi:hypothetical protein BaRGS_00007124 [Batillaria attramentaria]|uniref:Uncharacterized protein n=1 Tax=Batillaria attramentaria TaxID=370345 RepID=A0ABD0LRL9_9CAEN
MLETTLVACRGVYQWVTDFGVQRRGSSLGLQSHVTSVLLVLSLLLHACQCRREPGWEWGVQLTDETPDIL